MESGPLKMHTAHSTQMRGESMSTSPSAKSNRGRILPSSTADVQAAIAAIQQRSTAMRRQTAKTMSSLNSPEYRGDLVSSRKSKDERHELGDSSFDSDDSSPSTGQQYFADISKVIDHVNGKSQQPTAYEKDKEEQDADSISTDSDFSSDDDSLVAEGMVSNATQMNIGAFIDSLNAAAQERAKNPQVVTKAPEIDDLTDESVDTVENERYRPAPEIEQEEVQVPFNRELLETYMNKSTQLARSKNPKVSDLEYIVFYARRDKVPLMPVIDTFDEEMEEREECAVKRLSFFIRETIELVESKKITSQNQLQLLHAIREENFDVSMFNSILKNPKKHVKLLEPLEKLSANLEDLQINHDSSRETDDGGAESGSMGEADGKDNKESEKPRIDTNLVYFESKMKQLALAEKRFCVDMEDEDVFSRIPDVDGVESTRRILTKRVFKRHPRITPFRVKNWKLSDADRSSFHTGYKGVDSKAVLKLAVQADERCAEEVYEWENLGLEMTTKASLIENTDFFVIKKDRINQRFKEKFFQPEGIIMNKVKYSKQWEEEWYTSWLSRKNKERNTRFDGNRTSTRDSRSDPLQSIGNENTDPMTEDWGKDKNIGSILTTRFGVGERMSRVHPDYTSFLFMSKWKRKYYPKGIFTNVT